MSTNRLPRNREKPQATENRDFTQNLTLTCPILRAGILASSQTVRVIESICLHDNCQLWKKDIHNCIFFGLDDLVGVLQELKTILHFGIGRRPEAKDGKKSIT